jgi:hypothetical protein
MTVRRSVVLFVLLLGGGTPAAAQDADRTRPVFTRDAITRALSDATVVIASAQDPRADWARVRQLAQQEIVLHTVGAQPRACRVVAVDDTGLTVVDTEGSNRMPRRVGRADVTEIRRWTGRRGSVVGAVIGAGAGAFLGVVTALNLAVKDCGGGCGDEKFLMGVSLVGMPLAGGWLGYKLPSGSRTLTTVYVKP